MKKQKKRKSYESDLTDSEWNIIEPLLPPPSKEGTPRKINIREVINAINYLLKSGCTWRLLPHDFPDWRSVYYYFRTWKKNGDWKRIHDRLRDKVRLSVGKKVKPTAGIIDSQSVKTVKKGDFVAMTLVKR
jgi:putative transposase